VFLNSTLKFWIGNIESVTIDLNHTVNFRKENESELLTGFMCEVQHDKGKNFLKLSYQDKDFEFSKLTLTRLKFNSLRLL
jgi:hypothetical protein